MMKLLISILVVGVSGAIPFILDGYLRPKSGTNHTQIQKKHWTFKCVLSWIKLFSGTDYSKPSIYEKDFGVIPDFYEPIYHYYDEK